MALVPFSYNIRSLQGRLSSTLMTIFSIAATVAVLAGMLCLQQGFSAMFAERGREDLAVFLRPGSGSEGESSFPKSRADILIKGTPEIAIGENGQPLASGELFLAIRRPRFDGGDINIGFRGVQPATFDIHGEGLKIVEGRNFEPGSDELIIGHVLPDRIRDCRVGDVLLVNTTPFRVVGAFQSDGSHDSEIWGDVDRLREALQRNNYSRILAQLQPGADVAALAKRLSDDRQVPAKVQTEREYLSGQTEALSGIFIGVGLFLSILMGTAAVFTGTNAMLSAVASRTREIGILLSMGFKPFALFMSFLMEATLIGFLGGVVGCIAIIPLNGMQTGTMNFDTFSESVFAVRITPFVLITSVSFAMVLGLVGGAIPAWRAARMAPTVALRRG